MNYYLMNKDERILSFHTEERLGSTVSVEDTYYSGNLPFGFTDVTTWLNKRDYAKHKQHFQKWLREWNMDSVDGFIATTHCLGINDCLWVKQVDSELRWDNVSLYTNEFSDIASQTAFDTGLHGLQLSSTSPEFTAEGSFPKFWKSEKSGIYLYKAGQTGAMNVGLEPYAEFMASKIAAEIASQPVVNYDLVKYKSKLCSKCHLFTSEDTGFVPMYQILDPQRSYPISEIIDICKELGYEQECAEMFFVDSLIFNQDRHLGNFGFLVDNENFSIKGFAPLFDFNVSMLCNATNDDLNHIDDYLSEYNVGHKLGGTFADVGKALAMQYGFKLANAVEFPVHGRYNMEDERNKRLKYILENNAYYISGKSLKFVRPVCITTLPSKS